jgi:hypothetical protein
MNSIGLWFTLLFQQIKELLLSFSFMFSFVKADIYIDPKPSFVCNFLGFCKTWATWSELLRESLIGRGCLQSDFFSPTLTHLTTYNAWSYIYIFLYLFVRSLTPLCFIFVHCGWILFTNCSTSGLDTTQSIGIMCKLFVDVNPIFYFIYHWRTNWLIFAGPGSGIIWRL